MSRGRIAKSNRRFPSAKRRAQRYRSAQVSRRSVGLPPHLLPGVTGRGVRRRGYLKWVLATAVLTFVGMTIATATVLITSAAAVAGTVDAYRKLDAELPDAAQVAVDTFETTRLYDRNGLLLQQVDQPEGGWRTFVSLDKVSPYMVDATVAAEDSTFWTHFGVEPMAILRGVVINFSGSGSSGGSTITQQLARGLYPEQIGNDYSVQRKFREAMAAVALDREFSKQDILTMYVNQIFYGQRSYGIEAAANTYFNKRASELTLGESALLAGLPQAPSYYDPTVNFDVAKRRQQYVLDQMVKYRYITREQADDAWAEPLHPETRNGAVLHAPHFTQYVREYIEERWPGALYNGGLKITTSIDVALQEKGEQILSAFVNSELTVYGRNNAAMVVMSPWNGQILAMVGSASFDDPFIGGQVNYTLAPIQPGSSIKPIVYAAAFEAGWNPGTIVFDDPLKEPTGNPQEPWYEPNNYSGSFYGAVSVRTALANSFNISAVKALKYAGGAQVEDLSRRMGYTDASLPQHAEWYGLSMALGSGEVRLLDHTNAYATLANNGKFVAANPILKIEDSQGNVLYDVERDKPWEQAPQGLKAEYAYQITSILTDNQARSLIFTENNLFGNTQQQLGRPTAAKSGTTNGWKDIWTMGYTSDLAIGVWAGNTSVDGSSPTELTELDGIQGAGPIWQSMMVEMHQNPQWAKLLLGPNGQVIPEDFPRPAGIVEGQVCAATGNKAANGFESQRELLVRGEGPSLACDQISVYQRQELDGALKDLREGTGSWSGAGAGRIERFASAVGYYGGSPLDSYSGGSSGGYNGDDGDNYDDDDSPQIVPVDSTDDFG